MAGFARPFHFGDEVLSTAVFDGHNDVLYRLWSAKEKDPVAAFFNGNGKGQLDFPRMQAGGMVGGFFAIFAPSPTELPHDDDDLNPPESPSIAHQLALTATLEMAALLEQLVAGSDGRLRMCCTARDIRDALRAGVAATIFHIEGAEAIGPGLVELDTLYARGLRSIGPVWSRSNIFGHGVPFRFPSTGDTGPGLTEVGKQLVRRCNELRVLVDLSHLNEKGFWDVAKISNAPLVATHSNAQAQCRTSRNLSDEQLAAIGQSEGMVGLNFANGFLREDGRWSGNTPVEVMLRHLDHMIAKAGEDSVGLGSDYDGARIPDAIRDVAGLPVLVDAMRKHGYGDALISKLCHGNWLRVLEKTWGV